MGKSAVARFRARNTPSACTDEILWLSPRRQSLNACRGGRFRRWAARCTGAVAVAAGLNLATLGTAVAPALAHTRGDVPNELALPGILAVERAPIPIPAASMGDLEAVLRGELDTRAPAELRLGEPPASSASADPAADGPADPNEIVQFGAMRIPRAVVEPILRAAAVTGADPVYMMALADKESSFSPDVKARTSSAEGLFQFLSKTWLALVRSYGPRYGLADEAAAVAIVDGQPVIKDDAMRERVLGLRRDPYVSAVMAAEMMNRDRAAIERRIGRDLNRSEFYLAHFLGADGAGKLMALVGEKPKQSAPRVFRDAAKANRGLFFARDGKRLKDLTVAEVYARLDRMIDTRISRYSELMRTISVSEIDLRARM